ncbi:signal peptide containing protein [Theileria equi strain WA]|uniref:Signal peptide containing protein n=1 Tax=Theileria equi strain WA TaxID=1537102 RepID=L1LBC2_THEEQ|nr:signal peptide containing protein [Theileria equi strain WA]EKX72570.1 signal peptide containing protein [Theileria equi strain WA]|eukprot:XP_004832022.1 signal peptide containing protein [Theileria equi strain WA]
MRVLAVLLTVCLVGVCYCGDNDGKVVGKRAVPQKGAQQQKVVQHAQQGQTQANAQPADKPVESQTPKEDVSTETTQSAGQSGATLDISSIDSSSYQSFDYSFSGNAIRLIVPKKGVTVTKLMNGTEEVYTLSTGETFEYSKLYLNKDKNPELVRVWNRNSSGLKCVDYLKNGSKWEPSRDSDVKIKSLQDPVRQPSIFDMNLSANRDTNTCSVFQVDLLGVTTKHFYPKHGYATRKVKNGDKIIWTGRANDRCLSCIIHKHGSVELLEMVVVETLSERSKYFEKNGEEWMEINKTDFDQKLNEMRKSVSLATLTQTPSNPASPSKTTPRPNKSQ